MKVFLTLCLSLISALILTQNLDVRAQCEASVSIPGVNNRLSLIKDNQHTYQIYDQSGVTHQTCYRGAPENVKNLNNYFHQLLQKYYPVPYPPESGGSV